MFLTFLLENKIAVFISILLLAIAAETTYIYILKSDERAIVAEKATLTTELTESQANLVQLQNDIHAQNTAIEALKTEGDARVAKHAAEVAQAQNTAKSYKQKADDLLKRQPKAGVAKCDSANSLINEEIKNAHK